MNDKSKNDNVKKPFLRYCLHEVISETFYLQFRSYLITTHENLLEEIDKVLFNTPKKNTILISENSFLEFKNKCAYLHALLNEDFFENFIWNYAYLKIADETLINKLKNIKANKRESVFLKEYKKIFSEEFSYVTWRKIIINDYVIAESYRTILYLLDQDDDIIEKNIQEALILEAQIKHLRGHDKYDVYHYKYLTSLNELILIYSYLQDKLPSSFSNNLNKEHPILKYFQESKFISEVDSKVVKEQLSTMDKNIENIEFFKNLVGSELIVESIKGIDNNLLQDEVENNLKESELYEKIMEAIYKLSSTYSTTRSKNLMVLKESLLSDILVCYESKDKCELKYFTSAIRSFIISDTIMVLKHNKDIDRSENRKTFLIKQKTKIQDGNYLFFHVNKLIQHYFNDYKQKQRFLLVHIVFYMCVKPEEAVLICKYLGFYKDKSVKQALVSFNRDLIIHYPNFELLRGTSFFH